MNKQAILATYPNLNEGTAVRSLDGDKLGKIIYCGENTFVVEKGFFFPKDFQVSYDDIQSVSPEGDLIISRRQEDLLPWKDEQNPGWRQHDESLMNSFKDHYPQGMTAGAFDTASNLSRASEETRIPVSEEKLEVDRNERETGQVRVTKSVRTEQKNFTVPVSREEVRVERTPVSGSSEAVTGESSFQNETVTVPVMEEEIEIRKRPVVREEVRIVKDKTTEQRNVSGEVRKEEVEIEDDTRDNLRKKVG